MDFLNYVEEYQVLICRDHRHAIKPNNIVAHLTQDHHFSKKAATEQEKRILEQYELQNPSVANEVNCPIISLPAYADLQVFDGWKCILEDCTRDASAINVSFDTATRHRSKIHGSRYRGVQGIASIQVQCFFIYKKLRRYFEVQTAPTENNSIDPTVRAAALDDFRMTQTQWKQQFETVPTQTHPSEQSPWLRFTGYWNHLSGQSKPHLRRICELPSDGHSDDLRMLCDFTSQVLRAAEKQATFGSPQCRVAKTDLRTLATFHRGDQNPSPFQPLQNGKSLDRYINCWLGLLCYCYRFTYEGEEAPVVLSTIQQGCLADAIDAVRQLDTPRPSRVDSMAESSPPPTISNEDSSSSTSRGEGSENHVESNRSALQKTARSAVLKFSLSLLQQNLWESAFESPVLSYSAIKSLRGEGSWMEPAEHTSFLAS